MEPPAQEPRFGKKPQARPPQGRGPLLMGTALILVLGFVALIFLVFVFSALSPALMGKCVAEVEITGPITVAGEPTTLLSQGYPGSEQIASTIKSLDRREDVGAVLLVIDSPGGSAVGGRQIYEAVDGVQKPKVAYFREVAASSGYYIAAGTDYIVSEPDALTGSIGAYASFTSMAGLFDKLGINMTFVKSGEMKDMGSPARNASSEELAVMQSIVDESFAEFKATVISSRGSRLDRPLFEEAADGRVLSGRQAAKIGLVDETGSREKALMKAADMANISYNTVDDIRVCRVSTSSAEAPLLLSMDSLLRRLLMEGNAPRLSR